MDAQEGPNDVKKAGFLRKRAGRRWGRRRWYEIVSNKHFGFTNKICVYADEHNKGRVLDAIELREVRIYRRSLPSFQLNLRAPCFVFPARCNTDPLRDAGWIEKGCALRVLHLVSQRLEGRAESREPERSAIVGGGNPDATAGVASNQHAVCHRRKA